MLWCADSALSPNRRVAMTDTTLELFRKLSPEKQTQLIALITKFSLDYQQVFAALLKAVNKPR